MILSKNYIPLDECKHGYLYHIRSRNLTFGVFSKAISGFLGIREKFESRYVFAEYHHDTGPPYGTVWPKKELEEYTGIISEGSREMFDYLEDAEYRYHWCRIEEDFKNFVTLYSENPNIVGFSKGKNEYYYHTKSPISDPFPQIKYLCLVCQKSDKELPEDFVEPYPIQIGLSWFPKRFSEAASTYINIGSLKDNECIFSMLHSEDSRIEVTENLINSLTSFCSVNLNLVHYLIDHIGKEISLYMYAKEPE
jgi:hypothetical protein